MRLVVGRLASADGPQLGLVWFGPAKLGLSLQAQTVPLWLGSPAAGKYCGKVYLCSGSNDIVP